MPFARVFLVLVVGITIAACKIRVVVPEGGSVTTASGAYVCPAGATCTIDVVDVHFSEVFKVVPADGYKFRGWKKRDFGFCGGSKQPCELSTAAFASNDALMALLESDQVFYLQPRFKKVDSQTGGELTGCAVYAGTSPFCAEGTFPTCDVTRQQAFQITNGMTYEEVVSLLGCHGSLNAWSESFGIYVGNYQWGSFTGLIGVTFNQLRNESEPTVDLVVTAGF